MKKNVVLFWVIFLSLPTSSFSQKNRAFNSIEATKGIHCDSVYQLDLSKQKLTQLPIEILSFKNLTILNLSKNKLTKLPSNFYQLKQLTHLDLSKNKFTIFPISLCSTVSLIDLKIGRNDITLLPKCIGQLTNLEHLDIWDNQISALPDTFSKLIKLKTLDYRGVNFSSKTQAQIQALIPWVKIEFDLGCDCAH